MKNGRPRNQHRPTIASFFLNDRGSELAKSRRGFLQSLLHQILLGIPGLFEYILPEYRNRKHTEFQWPLDVLEKALLSMIGDPEARSIVFVIDALDECEKSERDWLLKFVFENLAKNPSLPQILITSRPDSTVECLAKDYLTVELNAVNNKDIEAYAKAELQFFLNDPDYQAEDIKDLEGAVISQSEGVFLWVTLVIRELKEQMDSGRTVLELKETLRTIPRDLLGLYDRIFQKLKFEKNSEAWRMLALVLFAKEPLKTIEFQYAFVVGSRRFDSLASLHGFVGTSSQTERLLQKVCGGLLELKIKYPSYYGRGAEVVQLIHQSVKDYLLGQKVLATSSFSISPSKAHNHLARVCIAYVTLPESEEYSIYSRPIPEWRNILFLVYATRYWVYHASLVDVSGTKGARLMEGV